MTKILTIGEVMLEMSDVGDGLFKKSFAGDTFNVAHYINVASHGLIKAEYLTALGQDDSSRDCLSFLEEMGVSTNKVQTLEGRTIGLFVLSNDAAGEKKYGYWRGQSAARHLFDQVQDLSGFDIVYFSGITAAITENKNNLIKSLAQVKQNRGSDKVKIIYDFNHRAQLWSKDEARDFAFEILPLVDIAKISDEELVVLYDEKDVQAFSKQYSDTEWVLTCGGEKAEVWQAGERLARQCFTSVTNVVDTSAAGDAFIGTYLTAKSDGSSLDNCLKKAHSIASQVVCAKGSIVKIDLSKLN
ncbi:sugar kinase [Kiloniella antarctica]|uniref:Sugar kinase n=1 Tax=Kiloniella antarctica TaxID=1550907 RepID=A0ABW5BQ80_9PROT